MGLLKLVPSSASERGSALIVAGAFTVWAGPMKPAQRRGVAASAGPWEFATRDPPAPAPVFMAYVKRNHSTLLRSDYALVLVGTCLTQGLAAILAYEHVTCTSRSQDEIVNGGESMAAISTSVAEVKNPVPLAFKKILLAVNEGVSARIAIAMASRLAAPGVTRLALLHLQRRETSSNKAGLAIELETYEHAIDFLAKTQAELRELGFVAEVRVGREVSGKEAEQILRAGSDFGADVIIVGNRRKSWLEALLKGSTTRDLVRKSATPLLLIPETTQR